MTTVEAEFHGPDWVLGQRTMAETADGTLLARRTASGQDTIVAIEPAARRDAAAPAIRAPAAALRLDHGPLCARRRAGVDREHAGCALQRLGLDAGGGRSAAAATTGPRPRRCGRGGGGALHADGAHGARRARPAVPADAARHRGPGRQRAAVGDVVPRRPDLVGAGGLRPDPPVLHQPWLRRGVRRLRGQLRLRAGTTAVPCGADGVSPTRRTASMPHCISRRRARSMPGGWPSGAAVRAA